MNHIIVAVMLCSAVCQPDQIAVWDGDTFLLGASGHHEKIRIANIDTAEIEGRCESETALAFRARERLAQLLEGQQVSIHRTGSDKYGRTLATIRVNGADVGDLLVREELARVWTGRRLPWCDGR